ncbi:hypothetical protein G6F64_015135 [Rhizopus arrhizus]|uniref:Uncharacterized protein n=1 Tax=Rhizopus oryzae TaxID=64495 RepID=A0A9P6WS64_RHIOR|nr:hypothetical protein G6F64_015135 [Rhizopus arrhizus]
MQADAVEQERAQCLQHGVDMRMLVLQRQQLDAARLLRLQADVQLVQNRAVFVIEDAQHQLVVVLLQA